MTASKGGFVALQYGQRRPTESGTPIELADGQTIDKLSIALPRGSVLGGRITDAVLVRIGGSQAWSLKSVGINGQDITDTPTEFPQGQTVTGMQIVLTKKISTLTGQVTDSKGTPVLDATVVVFPSDEKLWTYQSRFIKAARPDQDGKYRVSALPPESYLVVALQGLEDGQAGDPDFLATVKDLATKLDLGEGESKAVDVKLAAVK